jgi:hypothetical protein
MFVIVAGVLGVARPELDARAVLVSVPSVEDALGRLCFAADVVVGVAVTAHTIATTPTMATPDRTAAIAPRRVSGSRRMKNPSSSTGR